MGEIHNPVTGRRSIVVHEHKSAAYEPVKPGHLLDYKDDLAYNWWRFAVICSTILLCLVIYIWLKPSRHQFVTANLSAERVVPRTEKELAKQKSLMDSIACRNNVCW